MRKAYQNTGIFRQDDALALSFGFDFCAEHEWGIGGLERLFGVSADKDDLTVNRFKITKTNEENVCIFRGKSRAKHKRLFLLGGDYTHNQTLADYVAGNRESFPQEDKPEALWDENRFMFSVPLGGQMEEDLLAMHVAIKDHDALMYRMAGTPFGGSGLVIARLSTIPSEMIENMEATFRDQKALRDAAEATGIRKRIEEWEGKKDRWGKAFHALTPKWIEGFQMKKASAHPVIFWLNPTDQSNNNYGWYTVEDLEQWMEGKGPIPKAKGAAA